MNVFAHLNYRYPGTPNAAWTHVSQQPQEASHRTAEDVQQVHSQPHLGDGYTRSDSGRIVQAGLSSDSTAGYCLHPRHNSTTIGPRGAVHSDPTGPTMIRCVDGSSDLCDQYIPSSGDKITCADHRPLDEIFGNVRPSSGYPQTKSGSIYPSHNGTQRGHPRHPSVLTYPLPNKPQLDGVVQIPLLAVDNQRSGTGLVVDFRRSDWGIGVRIEGIPVSDLLRGNVSDLEDPYQRVLDGFGLTDLRLNILWPHYPPLAKVISAFGTDGKPITRAELGYEVALAFAEFFYYMTLQAVSPVQPGPYTIVSSYTGSSTPGITFDQLHLIAVRNTSHGEWMAEVRAITMSSERERDA